MKNKKGESYKDDFHNIVKNRPRYNEKQKKIAIFLGIISIVMWLIKYFFES